MATDMQRLIVALEARTKAFENALNKANGTANRRARAIESRFARMNSTVSAQFTRLGTSIAGAFAVAGGLRGMQSLIDGTTRIDNALKVAGLSGEELEKVYGRLRDSAVKSAAPLEALVELYGRAALVQKELGISGEELLGFTDKIAVALRVSGKSAAESSGALLQLSQALGSGVVRAEEFNSILEGALPIAQAAARGLKEAGGSVATLRQLVVDGKVSSEAFFRAFEAGAPMLEDKVKDAELTTSQAMENIKTAMQDAAREFVRGSMAAESLADAFQQMADYINSIDFEAFGEEVRKLLGWINEIQQALNFVANIGANFGRATGLENIGEAITGGAVTREFGPVTVTSEKALRERIDRAFGVAVETASGLTEDAIRQSVGQVVTEKTGRLPSSVITPVSLGDYAPPSGSKKKGGGSKKANEFAREIEQIKERTAALQAETAAQAGLNPLVNDYGFAVEKAKAAQELLNAAKKAGLAITPELTAKVDELAGAYAQASVDAEKLAESQDKARQTAEDMKALGKDVLGGFIKDLQAGKTASEALSNALGKIADKLLDIALNSIFDGGGLGGLFGFIPKLFGFAEGGVAAHGKPLRRFARGGVSRSAAIFGEAGPEAAVPLPDGRSIPVTLSTPQVPRGNARNETVRVVLQDDSGRMAKIAQQEIQTAAGPIIQISVRESQKATKQNMPSYVANAQTRKM